MDSKSQQKVIAAGFTILRSDDQPTPRIKCRRTGFHNWVTWQSFDNEVSRDRRLKELLKEPKYIFD